MKARRTAIKIPVPSIRIGHRIASIGSDRFREVESVTPDGAYLHVNGRSVVSVTTVTGPTGKSVRQRTIFDGMRGGECWDMTGFCMRELTDQELADDMEDLWYGWAEGC